MLRRPGKPQRKTVARLDSVFRSIQSRQVHGIQPKLDLNPLRRASRKRLTNQRAEVSRTAFLPDWLRTGALRIIDHDSLPTVPVRQNFHGNIEAIAAGCNKSKPLVELRRGIAATHMKPQRNAFAPGFSDEFSDEPGTKSTPTRGRCKSYVDKLHGTAVSIDEQSPHPVAVAPDHLVVGVGKLRRIPHCLGAELHG